MDEAVGDEEPLDWFPGREEEVDDADGRSSVSGRCRFSSRDFSICNLSSSVITHDFSIPMDRHFLNL